jgi:hypothetical protein
VSFRVLLAVDDDMRQLVFSEYGVNAGGFLVGVLLVAVFSCGMRMD